MTCNEIITAVDALKPNEYTTSQKLELLTYLDRVMLEDILLSHANNICTAEDAPESPDAGQLWLDISGDSMVLKRFTTDNLFEEVFPYTNTSDILLFDDTAAEIYRLYLMVQIDFYNSEYTRYNNDSAMFNEAYSRFERAFTRIKGTRAATRWAY